MRYGLALILGLFMTCVAAFGSVEQGLVAYWDFDEGNGNILHDRTGNGNDGTLHGAAWVRMGNGSAIEFSRNKSYVDFGANANLKLTGDMSFSAWVKLTAEPYLDAKTNWHLFNWEAYKKSGAVFRIGGNNGQPYFRSSQADGRIQQGFSNTVLFNKTLYHVVLVKKGAKAAFYVDGKLDSEMPVKDPTPNDLPFTLSLPVQSLAGILDNVRLYNRALSTEEVVALFKERSAEYGKDTSWIGKIKLTPFIYYDEDRAIIEADCRGVLPLRQGERVFAALQQAGKPPVNVQERDQVPPAGRVDIAYNLQDLQPGAYEVCVSVGTPDKARTAATIRLDYPATPAAPPTPPQGVVAALPADFKTPAYTIDVSKNGGFVVRFGNEDYSIDSVFSYPHGGENGLTVSGAPQGLKEKGWQVQTDKIDNATYRVVGAGEYYRISREIVSQATRILVKDTIENLTGSALGLSLDNRIELKGKPDARGEALATPVPPVFVRSANQGLGLVPLNDVYQFLQETYVAKDTCGSRIAGLGIPKGAAHTLEWAVYPIATTDYYDLVNAIRKDEGLNGLTVDGCLAMSHSGQWLRQPPPPELVRFGGLKYASSGCVTQIEDDPEIAIEGVEINQYPKVVAALKKNYMEAKKRYAGLKMGFHVAYNIWATNEPERLFPDSRVIASSGRHDFYASVGGIYFSKQRLAQGWAWYPYYPTLTNSFGKELLKSVDVMTDDIGAEMVWADGLLTGYGAEMGNYPTGFVTTLEPWDGCSVVLDPKTKTIARKFGRITVIGKEALLEYVNRINAKGGRVWINHMFTVPRAFARLKAYWAAETNDGDQRCASLHLSPAPHGLANPTQFRTAQMIYDDIRGKLSWGVLYTYYWYGGASQLTHPMITTDMYPITIEELHAGCVKGRERIITLHSGAYGWTGDRHLHIVKLWDARGRMATSRFLTTCDATSVRTRVDLAEKQTAIVIKLPVTIETTQPVNVCVTRFENGAFDLTMNGHAAVTLRFDEAGPVKVTGAPVEIAPEARAVKLDVKGLVHIQIRRDGP